jgi:hypothetical protein
MPPASQLHFFLDKRTETSTLTSRRTTSRTTSESCTELMIWTTFFPHCVSRLLQACWRATCNGCSDAKALSCTCTWLCRCFFLLHILVCRFLPCSRCCRSTRCKGLCRLAIMDCLKRLQACCEICCRHCALRFFLRRFHAGWVAGVRQTVHAGICVSLLHTACVCSFRRSCDAFCSCDAACAASDPVSLRTAKANNLKMGPTRLRVHEGHTLSLQSCAKLI